ncbi:MAG: PAS domain-containing sensor histidine kinase [Halioglobus sp.]
MNHTQSLSPNELEQAFAVFNRVSHELDVTYRELETKVAALTQELASARSARLAELAEKERLAHRLSSLVSALPGAVLIVDAQNIVRDANPQAMELLGFSLVGTSWPDVLKNAAGDLALDSQPLLEIDGMRYSASSRKLDDSGDQVILIADVSQVHELQEQLGRKRRLTALGEMAARLAHQIRTPLSSTTLYMTQLGRDDLPSGQRSEVVSKVNDRLDHMGNLLESMLGFVRGASPEKNVILLREVLQDFSCAVSPQFCAVGALLEVPSLDDTLSVEGDKDALVGALSNLAMNAIEASSGAVKLKLQVCALNDHRLQIQLEDDGPGIDEEIIDRIFDPFFTTRAAGTGLGLAVVANTVANHGGAVSAENTAEGGARFSIELPIGQVASVEDEISEIRKTGDD